MKLFKVDHSMIAYLVICAILSLTVGCTNTYKIHLKSDPPGATVSDINQGVIGKTDFTYSVEQTLTAQGVQEQSLSLTFSKEGYESKQHDLINIRNNQTVMVKLQTSYTYLNVRSTPTGAQMKLFDMNGDPLEVETTSKLAKKVLFANNRIPLPADTTNLGIELTQKGYKPLREEIVIEPGKENTFSFQMEEITTNLKIDTEPTGVAIYEKSLGFLGRTPLDLELKWDQLTRLTQQLDAQETSSVNLHLTAKKVGHEDEELTQKFFIYKKNPVTYMVLEPTN